MLAGYRSPRSC
uniref:Uncharacterized protein n=1 Tax=Anguilla anguilla TaxID=7936 RepID=A0A0E9VL11_ANGAN